MGETLTVLAVDASPECAARLRRCLDGHPEYQVRLEGVAPGSELADTILQSICSSARPRDAGCWSWRRIWDRFMVCWSA